MSVTQIDRKRFCAGVLIVFFTSSFNMTAYADAQEDAYLKALESEATELQDFEPPPDSPDAVDPTNADADGVSAKEKEFADRLKASLPNTYLIYKKLSKTQKGLVVEAYFVNDQSMAEASRQIFNIYFKRIK